MFLRKIKISITKLILPFLHKIFQLLKTNTRAVNFLNEKKNTANYIYNFQMAEQFLPHNNLDYVLYRKMEIIFFDHLHYNEYHTLKYLL